MPNKFEPLSFRKINAKRKEPKLVEVGQMRVELGHVYTSINLNDLVDGHFKLFAERLG